MKPRWLKVVPRKLDAHICRCGALVYRGWDDDLLALMVTVDRVALSPMGEVLALRRGLVTYTVESNRLYVRYWWRMKKHRHDEFEVLAQHTCGRPIPQEFGRTEIAKPRKRKEAVEYDHPPF